MATQHGNIHAAIPLRSATQDSKSPYNCDTQTRTEHLEATPTVRNQSHVKATPPAPAAHPRYLSSPAGATLHGKTQGFVPKLSPKTKLMQHPCSHYNAFCNLTSPTRISLRTWQHNMATFMQPFHCDLQTKIQEPHRTTYIRRSSHCKTQRRNQKTSKRTVRTRRTPEVPFIARRSHFTRKNTRFRAQTISQNEAHATSMQPLQCVLQPHVANPHLSTHMATQHGNIHAAIPLRSANKDSRTA